MSESNQPAISKIEGTKKKREKIVIIVMFMYLCGCWGTSTQNNIRLPANACGQLDPGDNVD